MHVCLFFFWLLAIYIMHFVKKSSLDTLHNGTKKVAFLWKENHMGLYNTRVQHILINEFPLVLMTLAE